MTYCRDHFCSGKRADSSRGHHAITITEYDSDHQSKGSVSSTTRPIQINFEKKSAHYHSMVPDSKVRGSDSKGSISKGSLSPSNPYNSNGSLAIPQAQGRPGKGVTIRNEHYSSQDRGSPHSEHSESALDTSYLSQRSDVYVSAASIPTLVEI